MIPRYSHPEMEAIWSDQNRLSIWLEIETLALEGLVREGLAPTEALEAVKNRGAFDLKRVLEIENEVKHDVIAFLTNVAEYVGPQARYLHRGMTSSDVLDTALAVQLQRSGMLILARLDELLPKIWRRAEEFKYTPCIGRTHGIHAEPITFGLKLVGWFAELKRNKLRLLRAVDEVAVGKISGAVGTYAAIPPGVESFVMQKLGLRAETVSTQIVLRDRHAAFFAALAQLASSIERFCTEIRHLQRSEVREVEELFSAGQKGSSAMPHKKNPILCENLCGLARLVRGYAATALENVALWHERDISHSSVERVIAPDSCILVDFMLRRFSKVVEGLRADVKRMEENLSLSRGVVFSGTLLLALTDAGMSREAAYGLVQQHALAAWAGGGDFRERVEHEPKITALLSGQMLAQVLTCSTICGTWITSFRKPYRSEPL